MMKSHIIEANWPAPQNVRAFTSLRQGGVSAAPYESWNLAEHVGDQFEAVQKNRFILESEYGLPSKPVWLSQNHTTLVLRADQLQNQPAPLGDASFTRTTGVVCAVLTADCLPILICDRFGSVVAAVHAGWKGLSAGILIKTLEQLAILPEQTLIWLGPAIGPQAFEVGSDVLQAFLSQKTANEEHFVKNKNERWYADLYAIARSQCKSVGVTSVYGGEYCTYSDPTRFYSYRREGQTGRMASVIYLL